MKSNHARSLSFLPLSLLLLGTLPSSAVSIRSDVDLQQYLDLAAPFDAVGRVYDGGYIASATLVSTTQILTAAHFVDANHDGIVDQALTSYSMRFGTNVNSPSFTLTNFASISINPLWNGSAQHDMAVMTLTTMFMSINPIGLSDENPVGTVGTMVGYGLSGTGAPPFENNLDGLRRAATNTIDLVGTSIRTDFDSPYLNTNTYGSATPLALEGTTAGGDSGGPLLVDFGSGYRIVGSLNGGYNPYGAYSEYGDVSIWAPIDDPDNIAFLQGMGIAVPEPSSAAMLALVLGLAVHRRKRCYC